MICWDDHARRINSPRGSAERRQMENLLWYRYAYMDISEFRVFLAALDLTALLGKAIGTVLVAFGLDWVRQKMVKGLEG